jgi:hypothetical protein
LPVAYITTEKLRFREASPTRPHFAYYLRKRYFRIARYSHHSIVIERHWIERRDYFDGELFFRTKEA